MPKLCVIWEVGMAVAHFHTITWDNVTHRISLKLVEHVLRYGILLTIKVGETTPVVQF